MNDHDLFEDGPDLTPTPTPAPVPGPATSGPGGDDDENQKAAERRLKLSPLQQGFLAEDRRALHGHSQNESTLLAEFERKWKESRALSAPVLARLVNKTHLGPWDDVWSLVDSLYLRHDEGYPYVFSLSGWCAFPKDLEIAPIPPSRRLLLMLTAFGIYGRASTLAAAYIANPTVDNADWLWAWVRAGRSYFKAASVDGFWSAQRIKDLSDAELVARTRDLQCEFLFLEHRLFWFTSSVTVAAWNDFFYFTLGYHYLPDKFKADLGPYALTIRTMPSAAPAAPEPPTLTQPMMQA